MYDHHRESITRAAEHLAKDPEIQALILGGSIAHGFAAESSDIDMMLIIADREYEQRVREGRLQYFDAQVCTYDGGYIDGKYLGRGLLQTIAERGTEPARFAFLDAQVLFSRLDGLDAMLDAIVQYPLAGKAQRIQRFYAQFEAWHWYAHEGLKLNNRYLLNVAAGKLVLFGGRLILAHNEILYPYHKWFLKVLERAADKPDDLLSRISALSDDPRAESLQAFYDSVVQFRPWEYETPWPIQFMLDSELNWLDGPSPVDDL